jgi:hypothetical protein
MRSSFDDLFVLKNLASSQEQVKLQYCNLTSSALLELLFIKVATLLTLQKTDFQKVSCKL